MVSKGVVVVLTAAALAVAVGAAPPCRLRTNFQPPDEVALSVPTDGLRLSWQNSVGAPRGESRQDSVLLHLKKYIYVIVFN